MNKLAQLKTRELVKTTPPLLASTAFLWPALAGEYAKFIGYGSKQFYETLSSKTDAFTYFCNSINEEPDKQKAREFWETKLPEEIIKNFNDSLTINPRVFVFQSLKSNLIVSKIENGLF